MSKQAFIPLVAVILSATVLSGFTPLREGGIMGRVVPAESAMQVLAIAGKDTLRTEVSNGNFSFSKVKKATYTVLIRARLPFKDRSLENIAVIDSAITDVGEIRLYN